MRREMRTRGPSNDNKHSSSPSRARSSSNQQQMLLAQAMDFSTHRRRLLVERLQRSMAAGEQQKHQQQQQRFMEVAHLHPGGIGHNLQHEQAGKGHLARNVHGGPIAGSRRSSPNRFASKRGNNNSGSSAARHRNIINDAARAVVAGHSRFEIGRLRQGGFDEMQHRIGMGQFGALNADTEMRKLFLQHEQVKAMDAQAARERAAYTIERAEMTMRQLQAAAERDPYAAAASHVAALEAKERRGAEVQQGQMQTLTAAALAHAALVAEQEARMRDSRTHGNGSSPNINPRTAPRESDRAADSHGGLSSSRRRMLREFLKNGLSCANDGSSPNADTGNNNLVTAAAENNHNHSILDVVRKHPEPGVMNQQAPQHAKIECEDDRQKQENRQIREALHQARDERWKMDADAVADSIHLVDKSAPVVPILPSWFEQMQHYTIPRMQYSQQQDQHQQRRISPPSRALQLYRNSPSRYRSRQPPKLADAAVAEAERRIGRIVHEKLTREQHWRQVRDPFVSMRPTQPAHQPFCAPGTQKSLQQRKEEKEEEDRNGGATASADPNRVKYGFPWQRYSWRDVDLDKEYPPLVAGDELKQPKRKSPEHHQAASSSTQRDAAQADVTIAAASAGGGHNYVEAHAKLSAAVAQQVSRLRRGEEEHRRQKKQQLDMQQRMLRLQRSYTPQPKSTSPAAAVTTPAAAAAQVSMSAVTVARPTTGGGSTPPQPKAAAVTNARASSNEGRHHSTAAYSGAAAAVVHQKSLDQPAHEQEQLPAREQQKQQSMVQPNRRGSIEEIKNNNSNSVSAAAGQRGSRASSASSSPLCHTLNSTTVTNSVATEARQRDSFVILSSQDSLVVSPAAPIPPSSAPEPLVPLFSGSAAASSAQRSKQQQETSTGSPTVVPLQEKGSSKPQLAAMLLSAQRASVPPPSSPAVTRVAPPSPLNEAKLRSLNIDDDDYDKEVDIFKRSADLNSASDAFRVEHHESKIREISLDNNSNNNNNGRRECTVIREYDLDNASNNDNSNRNEKNSSPAPQNQQQQQQQLLQSPVVRTQFSSDSPSREESPSNVDLLLPGDASKRGPLNPSSSVSSSSGAGLDCDIPIADWTKAADSAGAETPARSNASSGNEHHSCALARALRSQHGTATTTSSEREGSADSGSSIVDETDIQLQQQRPRPGGVAARTVAGL